MLAGMMKPKSVSKLLVEGSDYNRLLAKPNTRYDWLSYNTDNVDAYILIHYVVFLLQTEVSMIC